jgi:hypothetical protein
MSTDRKSRALLAELAGLGPICQGTLSRRFMVCGKPSCRCVVGKGHGPYFEWTRKVLGKTVSTRVSADAAKTLSGWIANDRKARALLDRLRALSASRVRNGEIR